MAQFKVVIVGGGPVGLIQAHALSRAKIDYVLLEARDKIVTRTGASLFIWPQTSKLFQQLGFLHKAEQISHIIDHVIDTDPNGGIIRHSSLLGNVGDSQGYPIRMFARAELVELLYMELPERESRVKTGKRVSKIQSNPGGVVVYLDDGTFETGSIIIGADGVWSIVRQQVAKLAPPGTMKAMPFTVNYDAVFGRSRVIEHQPNGYFITRHDGKDGIGFQLYITPEQIFFVAYRRAGKLGKQADDSDSDGETMLGEFMDERICGDVTIRDIWDNRYSSGRTELHQGLLKRWHWDRIALVGDAALKVTPNQGSGANNGFESAITLANKLQAMLQSDPDPNTAVIEKTFAAYQSERFSRAETWAKNASVDMDRMLWKSRIRKAMVTHLLPVADRMGLVEDRMERLVSKSSTLDPVTNGGASREASRGASRGTSRGTSRGASEGASVTVSWDAYTNDW